MSRHRKGHRPRPPLVPRIEGLPDHPVVTEHAMLRWLERVCGIDLKAVERDILAEGRAGMVLLLEDGRIPVGDGVRLVVRRRCVVTVLT